MGNMQTTINCMKLEALGNTIIGNGLPVIGSKCRQYVIRNMNNRLPTKSPRSDLDLVQQETHLALGSECLWTDRVTVACVVRVCVHKQYKQYIGEANVPCNCDLRCTRMFFYWAESLGQTLRYISYTPVHNTGSAAGLHGHETRDVSAMSHITCLTVATTRCWCIKFNTHVSRPARTP